MSKFMDIALREAKAAGLRNEVPVGAVLVKDAKIIAQNGNRILENNDPTAHAEILVIREACEKLGNERLVDCELYVTLEPCVMCTGAISFARIKRLYFGAADPKTGAVENGVRYYADPTCHHVPECYGGIQETQSAKMLRDFFSSRRT